MPLADPTPIHLLASLGTAVVVLGLLALFRSPVTRTTPIAVLPWACVAAFAHHLALQGIYPPEVEPLFGGQLVGPTVFAIGGALWLALRGVAVVRDREERGAYLVACGAGTALGLGVVTLTTLSLQRGDAFVLVGVPTFAVVLSAVGYLSLGLVDPPGFARARFAGYLVAFAQTLDGVASALLVDGLGRDVARPSVEAAFALTGAFGSPDALGVSWLLIVPRLVLSLSLVAILTRGSVETEIHRMLLLAALVAVGVGPGVTAILEAIG